MSPATTSKHRGDRRPKRAPERTALARVATIAACIQELRPDAERLSISQGSWGESVVFAYFAEGDPASALDLHESKDALAPMLAEVSMLPFGAVVARFHGDRREVGSQLDGDRVTALLLDLSELAVDRVAVDDEVVEQVRSALQKPAESPLAAVDARAIFSGDDVAIEREGGSWRVWRAGEQPVDADSEDGARKLLER